MYIYIYVYVAAMSLFDICMQGMQYIFVYLE